MGCPYHIVHNITEKVGEVLVRVNLNKYFVIMHIGILILQKVSGFQVKGLLVDILFWFDKSTIRQDSHVDYCIFCAIEYRQIIQHANMRWLSLERAAEHVLQQFYALKIYLV